MADIDDLKATFEQAVSAINNSDLNVYSALWHEQMIAFLPFSPFAINGKAAIRQAIQTFLTITESGTFTPINPQHRVIGTTGIAWGNAVLELKPKDGPMRMVSMRYTWIFAKIDGLWREVVVHGSLTPLGN